MDQNELFAEMERLVQAGDAKAADDFAIQHFKEFPEEVQAKILTGFYTEAIEKNVQAGSITIMQKEGVDALQQLQEIKGSVQKAE